MITVSFRQPSYSRRELLGMLGTAAMGAMLPKLALSDGPTFPKGAVIRTVLKDYAPEDLGGGATLFHEHMSIAPDFGARSTSTLSQPTRPMERHFPRLWRRSRSPPDLFSCVTKI